MSSFSIRHKSEYKVKRNYSQDIIDAPNPNGIAKSSLNNSPRVRLFGSTRIQTYTNINLSLDSCTFRTLYFIFNPSPCYCMVGTVTCSGFIQTICISHITLIHCIMLYVFFIYHASDAFEPQQLKIQHVVMSSG